MTGPDLPVVDAHHHLFEDADDHLAVFWGRRTLRADDYADLLGEGRVVATVAVEGHTRYRTSGPEHLRPGGARGAPRCGARPVPGHPSGRAVGRGPGRARRPVRPPAAPLRRYGLPSRVRPSRAARSGVRAFVLAPQLADVVDLARAFPDTRIVLDHLGNPVGAGHHAGRMVDQFPAWRRHMAELARCPAVAVKMSGPGTFLSGSPSYRADPPVGPDVLAEEWRPWVEETVEPLGADRVLFGSNLPTDRVGSFTTILRAYQAITRHCSDAERRALFAGTAATVCRLDLESGAGS